MIKEQKPINFEDSRGTIRDIYVNKPFEHCVIIHSTPGGIRGNHYHERSLQCDFMVKGSMKVFSRKAGSDIIEESISSEGEWIEWEKGEAHEFIAIDDVVFLSFVNGPRGGDEYESDTYHLKTPLHIQKEQGITDRTLVTNKEYNDSLEKQPNQLII